MDSVDEAVANRVLSGLDAIDWSALEHAYGPATTTPTYLRALLGDEQVRGEAVEHLWSAVTHQGTVYSATAAATPFLLRLLGDDAGEPIRTTLLSVLEAVAQGSSYHDVHAWLFPATDTTTPEWQEQLTRELAVVASCRMAAAAGLDRVLRFLRDPEADVRLQATATAASIAMLPEVPEEARGRVRAALKEVAAVDSSAAVRGSAVLSLSLTGAETRVWLGDASAQVRVAAALSPSLAGEPAAHAILLDALARPDELDGLFPNGLPQMDGFPRFTVIAAVCDRVSDHAAALPSLLAALRLASNWTVDVDRAPMLSYLFPISTDRGPLTGPQRGFLQALVERDDLWEPRNGNAHNAFKDAGLPYSQDAIREILARDGPQPA